MSYWCRYNEEEAEETETYCTDVRYVDDSEDSVYEDDPEWVSIVPVEGSE